MKSRSVVLAAAVAALLLSFGASCGRRMQPPVVDLVVVVPNGSSIGGVRLVVRAHDPDGDSIRLRVEWGDKSDTVTGFFSNPCSVELGHEYPVDSPSAVIVSAFDMNNVPEPVVTTAPVERCGRVQWFWQSAGEGAMMTSALVADDGEDEVVMSYSWDDFKFYSIKVENGRAKSHAVTKWPEYEFTGGPALCAATGHVIVGSDEGELYALSLAGLARAWRWPDVSRETLEPFIPFGAPAVSGADIYVGREDYKLYKFTDVGTSVIPGPVYDLDRSTVADAPAIDAAGNVYIGTDSGYLIKFGADLGSPIWRVAIQRGSEIHCPTIGADGTIYCLADSLGLSAIYPTNGFPLWSRQFYGKATRLAVGSAAIFVGTSAGMAYSVRPEDGKLNWLKRIGRGGFVTAPIVTANGYVYFQDSTDMLYCVRQADGVIWWACDCNRYLPGGRRVGNSPRPGKLGLTNYDPNPSITSNGDIIVVGQAALFCVAGYPEGPLDPLAPWPKWQHDLYNSGYAGGGR